MCSKLGWDYACLGEQSLQKKGRTLSPVRLMQRLICFFWLLAPFEVNNHLFWSCWHWQRETVTFAPTLFVSPHHAAVVSKSDDMIGRICASVVMGQQHLLQKEKPLSEACWSQSQGSRVCVYVCVCSCSLSAPVWVAKPSIKLPWQPGIHHPIHHPRATDGASESGERCHGRVER